MTSVVELDGHKLSRFNSDLSAVDHDPAVAGDNDVDVIVAVVEMVVRDGLSSRRKLYLIDLECRDVKGFTDSPVKRSRRRVRAMASGNRRRVDNDIRHSIDCNLGRRQPVCACRGM